MQQSYDLDGLPGNLQRLWKSFDISSEREGKSYLTEFVHGYIKAFDSSQMEPLTHPRSIGIAFLTEFDSFCNQLDQLLQQKSDPEEWNRLSFNQLDCFQLYTSSLLNVKQLQSYSIQITTTLLRLLKLCCLCNEKDREIYQNILPHCFQCIENCLMLFQLSQLKQCISYVMNLIQEFTLNLHQSYAISLLTNLVDFLCCLLEYDRILYQSFANLKDLVILIQLLNDLPHEHYSYDYCSLFLLLIKCCHICCFSHSSFQKERYQSLIYSHTFQCFIQFANVIDSCCRYDPPAIDFPYLINNEYYFDQKDIPFQPDWIQSLHFQLLPIYSNYKMEFTTLNFVPTVYMKYYSYLTQYCLSTIQSFALCIDQIQQISKKSILLYHLHFVTSLVQSHWSYELCQTFDHYQFDLFLCDLLDTGSPFLQYMSLRFLFIYTYCLGQRQQTLLLFQRTLTVLLSHLTRVGEEASFLGILRCLCTLVRSYGAAVSNYFISTHHSILITLLKEYSSIPSLKQKTFHRFMYYVCKSTTLENGLQEFIELLWNYESNSIILSLELVSKTKNTTLRNQYIQRLVCDIDQFTKHEEMKVLEIASLPLIDQCPQALLDHQFVAHLITSICRFDEMYPVLLLSLNMLAHIFRKASSFPSCRTVLQARILRDLCKLVVSSEDQCRSVLAQVWNNLCCTSSTMLCTYDIEYSPLSSFFDLTELYADKYPKVLVPFYHLLHQLVMQSPNQLHILRKLNFSLHCTTLLSCSIPLELSNIIFSLLSLMNQYYLNSPVLDKFLTLLYSNSIHSASIFKCLLSSTHSTPCPSHWFSIAPTSSLRIVPHFSLPASSHGNMTVCSWVKYQGQHEINIFKAMTKDHRRGIQVGFDGATNCLTTTVFDITTKLPSQSLQLQKVSKELKEWSFVCVTMEYNAPSLMMSLVNQGTLEITLYINGVRVKSISSLWRRPLPCDPTLFTSCALADSTLARDATNESIDIASFHLFSTILTKEQIRNIYFLTSTYSGMFDSSERELEEGLHLNTHLVLGFSPNNSKQPMSSIQYDYWKNGKVGTGQSYCLDVCSSSLVCQRFDGKRIMYTHGGIYAFLPLLLETNQFDEQIFQLVSLYYDSKFYNTTSLLGLMGRIVVKRNTSSKPLSINLMKYLRQLLEMLPSSDLPFAYLVLFCDFQLWNISSRSSTAIAQWWNLTQEITIKQFHSFDQVMCHPIAILLYQLSTCLDSTGIEVWKGVCSVVFRLLYQSSQPFLIEWICDFFYCFQSVHQLKLEIYLEALLYELSQAASTTHIITLLDYNYNYVMDTFRYILKWHGMKDEVFAKCLEFFIYFYYSSALHPYNKQILEVLNRAIEYHHSRWSSYRDIYSRVFALALGIQPEGSPSSWQWNWDGTQQFHSTFTLSLLFQFLQIVPSAVLLERIWKDFTKLCHSTCSANQRMFCSLAEWPFVVFSSSFYPKELIDQLLLVQFHQSLEFYRPICNALFVLCSSPSAHSLHQLKVFMNQITTCLTCGTAQSQTTALHNLQHSYDSFELTFLSLLKSVGSSESISESISTIISILLEWMQVLSVHSKSTPSYREPLVPLLCRIVQCYNPLLSSQSSYLQWKQLWSLYRQDGNHVHDRSALQCACLTLLSNISFYSTYAIPALYDVCISCQDLLPSLTFLTRFIAEYSLAFPLGKDQIPFQFPLTLEQMRFRSFSQAIWCNETIQIELARELEPLLQQNSLCRPSSVQSRLQEHLQEAQDYVERCKSLSNSLPPLSTPEEPLKQSEFHFSSLLVVQWNSYQFKWHNAQTESSSLLIQLNNLLKFPIESIDHFEYTLDPMETRKERQRHRIVSQLKSTYANEESLPSSLKRETLLSLPFCLYDTPNSIILPSSVSHPFNDRPTVLASSNFLYRLAAHRIVPEGNVLGIVELYTDYLYFRSAPSTWSTLKDHMVDTSDIPQDLDSYSRTLTESVELQSQDVVLELKSIEEVYSRRHECVTCALEFFTTQFTFPLLFSFFQKSFMMRLYHKLSPPRSSSSQCQFYVTPAQIKKAAQVYQKEWKSHQMTNFEYLMKLNTLSGRSYNDLSQYPIMPWILTDYKSQSIDLDDPQVYRDLSLPVGALNSERLQEFQRRYQDQLDAPASSPTLPPFLYGTHYSTPSIVLYYLLRLEPYTHLSLQYQNGKFDQSDRLFYDLELTYHGITTNTADLKELIPEFFHCSKMFENVNNLNLGKKSTTGESIENVVLPLWCNNDSNQFIQLHRKALESEHVSLNLHHWIDLIFGYKQTGQEAIEANNLFFHTTYSDSMKTKLSKTSDEITRSSTIDQIQEFGQCPLQLFTQAHGARLSSSDINRPCLYSLIDMNNSNYAIKRISSGSIEFLASSEKYLITIDHYGSCRLFDWKLKPNERLSLFSSTSSSPSKLGNKEKNKTQLHCDPLNLIYYNSNCFVTFHSSLLLFYSFWTGKCIKQYHTFHSLPIVQICRDASYFLIASRETCLHLYEIVHHEHVQVDSVSYHLPVFASHPKLYYGHTSPICFIDLNVKLDSIVSCDSMNILIFHCLTNGEIVHQFQLDQSISSITVSSQLGKVIVILETCVNLYTLDGQLLYSIPSLLSSWSFTEISPKCKYFLGIKGNRMEIQNLNQNPNEKQIVTFPVSLTNCLINDEEDWIILATQEGSLFVYIHQTEQPRSFPFSKLSNLRFL